uniref:Uncharacterized protein n=1 Tax=Oryza brachyantha TaxID=4533 RepID=J3LFR2_ORYBR
MTQRVRKQWIAFLKPCLQPTTTKATTVAHQPYGEALSKALQMQSLLHCSPDKRTECNKTSGALSTSVPI